MSENPLEVRRLVSEIVVPVHAVEDEQGLARVTSMLDRSARSTAERDGFDLGEVIDESCEVAEDGTPKAGEVARVKRTYAATRWNVTREELATPETS